jgi:hypothetical protein
MPTLYQMLSGGMTREEHREKSMLEVAKKRRDAKVQGKPVLDVHGGLDLLGMTPGVGAPADLLNAALYASKGDKSSSLLALSQAVPLIGLFTGAKKLIKPAAQIKKATDNTTTIKGFIQNIKYYIEDNPGVITLKEVKKDILNFVKKIDSVDSETFFNELKDYSKEKFNGLVTVPKTSFSKKGKWTGEPVKETQTIQEKVREQEFQRIRAKEMPPKKTDQRQATFAATKRSELR